MKKYIVVLIGLLFLVSACDEKELQIYKSDSFVSFIKSSSDTTVFSFFFYRDDVVEYPMIVRLTGDPGEARSFKMVANKEQSTLSEDLYNIPDNYTFREGMLQDTITVTLKNHADLLTNQYVLVLELKDGDGLLSAGGSYGKAVLKVSDKAEKPDWWDDYFARDYLGKYSRKKFELFVQVAGEGDLGDKTQGEKRVLTLKFKHWLEKQNPPIYDEENEEEMVVTVIG
jgi:hypothetical protein